MKKTGIALLAALLLFAGCHAPGRRSEETGENAASGEVSAASAEEREAATGTATGTAAGTDGADGSGGVPEDGREETYRSASALLEQAEAKNSPDDYVSAFELFRSIDGYLDSRERAEACCDGYIRAFYGNRDRLDRAETLRLDDKILFPLYKMSKYGAAGDFATMIEVLRTGDFTAVYKLAADNPQFCGQFRREAGNLLWRKTKSISSRLSYLKFNYRSELDDTVLLACAADRLTGVSGEDMSERAGDLFPSSDDGGFVPDIYVSDTIYEQILADCGTEAAGKVLVTSVIKPYQYSAAAALLMNTEYCLSFSVMEKLPIGLFPARLAETEYLIQCESGYSFVGVYNSGTDAVREYTAVTLTRLPDGEVLGETIVYGEAPPQDFEYTGKRPPYKSGGKPPTEEISAAILQFYEVIAGND